MGLHLIDTLECKITQSVWNFVEMHCHLTSFFVCEHGRLAKLNNLPWINSALKNGMRSRDAAKKKAINKNKESF